MPDPVRRRAALLNLTHGLTHYVLLVLATAALAMVVQEPGRFGGAYGPVLALGTGMFVLYGLGALPMGRLTARFGARAMIAGHLFGTGLGMLAAAAAPGPAALAAALAVTGLCNAVYHPVGTALLVEAAGDRVGRAVGINGVCGNLGVALAPVVTALVAGQAGWRWAFALPGLACLAAGLAWLRAPRPDPAGPARAGARPFPAIPAPVVHRAVTVLLLIAAVSGLVFNGFTLLLPGLVAARLAADPALLPAVGVLAFLATLCGGLAQLTVGRLIDRTTLRRVFLPLAAALVPALALLAWAPGAWSLPLAAIAAAAIFGQVTVNETMTARYVAPALRVRLYSVRFFVGFLGAALAPPLVGLLHAATGGPGAALLTLAAASGVTLACALAFPDRREELRPELWPAPAPVVADVLPAGPPAARPA